MNILHINITNSSVLKINSKDTLYFTYLQSQGLATETPSFQEKIDEISQQRRKPLGERSLLSNQDYTDSISSERISSEADYNYPGVCLSPPNLPMRNASIHHEEAYGDRNKVWKCSQIL